MAETLSAAIREVADELLEEHGARGVSPLEVARVVELRFTELFDGKAKEMARRSLVREAKAALRPVVEQESFPGFPNLPKTFTVPDAEGDYRYIKLQHATLGDEAQYLEVQRENARRVDAELDRAELRHEKLWSVPGASAHMAVVEAVRRLAQ